MMSDKIQKLLKRESTYIENEKSVTYKPYLVYLPLFYVVVLLIPQ